MTSEEKTPGLMETADDGTQQERETTSPAEAPTSPSLTRVTISPCDETPQKGASSSSSDPFASCTNPSTPRVDTTRLKSQIHREEGVLREPAHVVEAAYKNEERGKQVGADGELVHSEGRAFLRRNGRTPQELRERYRDRACHSFPTYGCDQFQESSAGEGVANGYSIRSSKDGVPVPDPMSKQKALKSVLSGSQVGPINTLNSSTNARHKRLPSVQYVEPQRSTKRQKTHTGDEVPKDSTASTSRHSALVPASPQPDPAPRTSPFVDLTESQQSADFEVVSNRSNYEPTSSAQVVEYRSVERAHSATASNKRPRRPRIRPLKCAQSTTPNEHFSDGEDDLTRDEDGPPRKKHALDQRKASPRTAFHVPPGVRTTKSQPEDISDDELASQDKTSRNHHAFSRDNLSSEDAKRPREPVVIGSRGDMTKVDFPKSKNASKRRLNVVRAVSGKYTLDAKDLAVEHRPVLKLDDDHNSLIAVDCRDERLPDYKWLEVKLMYCTKIQHSTSGTPLATISRPSRDGIGPLLVLEFAQLGDALTLGLWAEAKLKDYSTHKINCSSEDSDQLKKIFERQMQIAGDWEKKHGAKPDDLRLMEHHEATKLKSDADLRPCSRSRPTSAQQNSPTQGSRQTLRRSMQGDGSASTTKSAPTTDSFFALDDAKDRQTGAQRPRTLPSRQAKDRTSRPVLNSSPSLFRGKSPSPVSWISQNPNWDQIWDEKPLIFPTIGKNRASVYRDDISRLEEGEYLNDNLIGFYLRYLQVNLERENKALAERIYIMNTYFYPKLTDVKTGRGINYDGVKSWTAKVDIFSFDYVVVPVNESAHWYLAIICNPAKLLQTADVLAKAAETEPAKEPNDKTNGEHPPKEGLIPKVGEQVQQMSLEENTPGEGEKKEDEQRAGEKSFKAPSTKQRPPRKQDPNEARVITLDSLGVGHSPTCGNLKSYLVQEAKDKRNMEVEPPGTFGMTAKGIPEQEDHASCGAFLLGYMREFLKDPDGVIAKLVRKETPGWDITSPAMRCELRDIIIQQRKEQNALAAAKKAKRKSNAQSPATSKSPGKRQEAQPATPKTPQPVLDAPKNPSSIVKGPPAIDRLPLNNHNSPPARTEGGAAAAPVPEAEPTTEIEPATFAELSPEIEAPESSDAVTARNKEDGLLGPLKHSSEEPTTPDRVQFHTDTPPTVQVRTSPRHTKSKPANDDNMSRMLLRPLVSSPVKPNSESKLASKGAKRKLSNSEILLCELPSSPLKSTRKSKPVTDRSKKSISPSQQLLGEMHSSSDSTRQNNPTSQNNEEAAKSQESILIEDEEPLTAPPRTMTNGPSETSHYFSAIESSRIKLPPPSATKERKCSAENLVNAIPSIEEDTESQFDGTDKLVGPVNKRETVDLTGN